MAIKGTKQTLSTEENHELKPILVQIKGDETIYEFETAFLSGSLPDMESDEVATIMSGFDTVDKLFATYHNMILQTYEFLRMNVDVSEEEVMETLRTTTDNIFDGIENGMYDEFFQQIHHQ
jgi:hypothetical protein